MCPAGRRWLQGQPTLGGEVHLGPPAPPWLVVPLPRPHPGSQGQRNSRRGGRGPRRSCHRCLPRQGGRMGIFPQKPHQGRHRLLLTSPRVDGELEPPDTVARPRAWGCCSHPAAHRPHGPCMRKSSQNPHDGLRPGGPPREAPAPPRTISAGLPQCKHRTTGRSPSKSTQKCVQENMYISTSES